MTLEERLEALTARHEALAMNLEMVSRDIELLRDLAQKDGANIRALARIAEAHQRPPRPY